MNKLFFTFFTLPILGIAQMSTLQINHYLNPTNATVRESIFVDLSQIGSPVSVEVGLMKSATMVSGQGKVEASFSFFTDSASTNDLFAFDGDNFEWNTTTIASSTRLSAKVFHPSCFGALQGGSDLGAARMEFISELREVDNYNPASVIMSQYMVKAQKIDVAANGVTQTRQSSELASQTPLSLITGNPAQNDQGIYDVTITLTDPFGDMVPFNLARVGGPGFCIDDSGVESDDKTRLIVIPAQATFSFLLSNVVAGNWAILLDSNTGMGNQTYHFTASATPKSLVRSGWNCGRFGYCSLTSKTRSNLATEGSTISNPTVIGDDRSPASQFSVQLFLTSMLILLSYF